MGEPRNPLDPTILHRSFQLARNLSKLRRNECPSSHEFQSIAKEVNDCHASYQAIRPYLQPPYHFISRTALDMVQNIHDGVETICDGLDRDIRDLRERIERAALSKQRRYFNPHGGRLTSSNRDKYYQQFFKENDYSLERGQLQYADMLLKLVMTVFSYALFIHDAQSAAFPDHSNYLITGLHAALAELQHKERRERIHRRTQFLRVEASRWWNGYYAHQSTEEPLTPLAELSSIWVNAEARLAAQPTHGVLAYQRKIYELREQVQQSSLIIRQLDSEKREAENLNRQLTAANTQNTRDMEQLQRDNRHLNDMIDDLNADISQLRTQLQTERTEHQETAQEQEDLISGYRAQRDRARARLDTAIAEKQAAETNEQEARFARDQALHDLGHLRAAENRSSRRDASSRTRTSSRSHERPPVAMTTQSHRHRHSSSRTSGSSSRWSGTSTAVDDYNSYSSNRVGHARDPPPVNMHTKPTWINDVTRILNVRTHD